MQACEDHPRLCGEKHSAIVIRSIKWGSPPPMRGKETSAVVGDGQHRITPAYAGKSNCDLVRGCVI